MILLVNDDGIHAPGLRALYRALRAVTGEPVLVVAPTVERSGQGHAITLEQGLQAQPVLADGFFGFAVDGTPVDCCKLALAVLCHPRPRLVVSGINDGPNIGRSLFYSGTVGIALEAAIEGLPALAVSRQLEAADDLDAAATVAARIARACLACRHLRGVALNLNLPALPVTRWGPPRLAPHGDSSFEETYKAHRDPQRVITWQLHGQWREDHRPGTDADHLSAGHPTLSPLVPDLNHRAADELRLDSVLAGWAG